jgi:hypothetical protein
MRSWQRWLLGQNSSNPLEFRCLQSGFAQEEVVKYRDVVTRKIG